MGGFPAVAGVRVYLTRRANDLPGYYYHRRADGTPARTLIHASAIAREVAA